MKLTPKQQAFADYYIETGNALDSARRAGYKQPQVQGHENLEKPRIKAYIDERMKSKEKERIASQDEVLEYLTRVMRGEEIEEVPMSTAKEIKVIEKTPSIKDKTKAAELLGKRYAVFTEKVQHTEDQRVTIVNDTDKMKQELENGD